MTPSFELDAPDHFTVGTVGPPGQRVFYLQAREAGAVVTLKVEKEQVRSLGEYLAGILEKIGGAPVKPVPEQPLLEPITPAWPVASFGLGYDEASDRVVILANALREDAEAGEEESGEEESGEEESKEAPATARFAVTRAQATAFIERVRALMKAGRPTCPMCGGPIDPRGHVCPRANGHVVARE
jgi:uncharacterized repeat protein (TIGR03847 family)